MEIGTEETNETVPISTFSVPPDETSMASAVDEREKLVHDVAYSGDRQPTIEEEQDPNNIQHKDESGRDLAPVQPPRDLHLEQELVDYESEDGDIIPEQNRSLTKIVSAGGDKPQPAKISWNEWAGADAEITRRAEEKRRDPLEGMHRVSADARTNRGDTRDTRDRYRRHDASRHHRDHRHLKDSPPRHLYRESNTRQGDGHLRRGIPSVPSDIPPGMSRGHSFGLQKLMPTGLDPMHRSVRPAASRMMPPGLGISGSLSRDDQYSSRAPIEDRRLPMKEIRQRSVSPPRYVTPRRTSPERYRRPQRLPSPHRPGNEMPMEIRSRSPYNDRPPNQGDHHTQYRTNERNGPIQEREGDDYRRRSNNLYPRNKETARASPRRFIPDRRQAFHERHPVPRFNDDRYHYTGNPNRMPVAGGHWQTTRDRRRPLTPERPGFRHPSPQPPPRRYPRDLSPSRHRRDMGSPLRGNDYQGRPPQLHGRGRLSNFRAEQDYQRRFDGSQHRRYDDRHREPPHSPGRSKRQRQSPMVDQRSQREAVQLRGSVRSPHDNPPSSDVMSGGLLHHSESDCCWFYVDPQGNTQGPCTIAQFRSWLRTLADDPQFADEHKQFMSVEVWKEGIAKRYLMTELLEKNIP